MKDAKGTLHNVVKMLHGMEHEGHKVACEIRGQGLQRDFMKKLKDMDSMPQKAVKVAEMSVDEMIVPASNPSMSMTVADCNMCSTPMTEEEIAYEEPGNTGATVCSGCFPSYKAAKNPGMLGKLEHHALSVKENLEDYTDSLMNNPSMMDEMDIPPHLRENPMPEGYTFKDWSKSEAGKHGDNITFKDWSNEEADEFGENYINERHPTAPKDVKKSLSDKHARGFRDWAKSEMREDTHTHSNGTTHTHKRGSTKHTHRKKNPNSDLYPKGFFPKETHAECEITGEKLSGLKTVFTSPTEAYYEFDDSAKYADGEEFGDFKYSIDLSTYRDYVNENRYPTIDVVPYSEEGLEGYDDEITHRTMRRSPMKNPMMGITGHRQMGLVSMGDEMAGDIDNSRSNPLRMNGKVKDMIHEYSHAVSATDSDADKLMGAIMDGKLPHLTIEKMQQEINKVSGMSKVRRNPMDFEQFIGKGSKGKAQRVALSQMHKCPETIVDEIVRYSKTGLQDDSLTAFELWSEWCSPSKLTA